jgi:hypothetical protein
MKKGEKSVEMPEMTSNAPMLASNNVKILGYAD